MKTCIGIDMAKDKFDYCAMDRDLKELLTKHSGSYLLNLSITDKEMIEIFGNPDLVTDHYRPTTKGTYDEGSRWKCGYWWKFNHDRKDIHFR